MMKTVLVVDDEVNFVRSLSTGLARQDIRVLTACNGKEAVDVLRSVNVDVLLTDLRMPEMDGFELVAHVETHHPEVPVIVMTAFGTPEIFERVRGMGSLFYIEKPLDLDRLVRMISDAYSMRVQGRVKGISLAAFIQLIDLEQKTCTLKVTSGTKSGALYCLRGQIIDAETGELSGLPAAYEMLLWNEVAIEISNVCVRTEHTIDAPSSLICLNGTRLRDEAARAMEEPGEEAENSFVCDSSVFDCMFDAEPPPGPAIEPSKAASDEAPIQPPVVEFPDWDSVKSAGDPQFPEASIIAVEETAPSARAEDSVTPLVPAAPPHDLDSFQEMQAGIQTDIEGFVASVVLDSLTGAPVAFLSKAPEFDISPAAGHFREIFSSALEAFAASSWGMVREVLMPGEQYTVLMRSLAGGRYRQVLAVTSETPAGMVRAVLKRHADFHIEVSAGVLSRVPST